MRATLKPLCGYVIDTIIGLGVFENENVARKI
jgi:hypothetical protein